MMEAVRTSETSANFHNCLLGCEMIVDRRFRGTMTSLMMEAAHTSETSVDNYFTRQYIPEDNSELHTHRLENFKSHT
jgi:hypothetical protein